MLKLEISYRGLVLIILALVAVWAFIELWPVILLVLISLILMIGLLPYIEAMVRRGLPRGAAVLLLMLGILGVVVALVSIMVPALIAETKDVKENLPASAREIEELLSYFGINVELQERARNIDWDSLVSGRFAFDAGQRVATIVISVITVVVMTAYLLTDTPRLGRFITQFIPAERRSDANLLFLSLTRVVGGYLRGQAITSLAITIFTFGMLQIVGVPNSLAFAVLAGFADVVPLVGALVATVPPVAAALQESSTQALAVLVAMALYQQFEDRLLIPRVYGRTLNLPPIIVLIAVLAGAELLGVIGVLLALPLTAAGRVALDFMMANPHLLRTNRDQILAPDSPEPEEAPGEEPIAPGAEAEASST